jgi:hypothetical protein
MKLTVKERILIPEILPEKSNSIILKIMRKFKEELSFDAEENRVLKFKYSGDQVTWEEVENIVKDIQVSDLITELLIKSLKQMDKDNELPEKYLSLFEKFVEGESN